jgi:hypothetical protein
MNLEDLSPETKREIERMALDMAILMTQHIQLMAAMIQAKVQRAAIDEGEEWKR